MQLRTIGFLPMMMTLTMGGLFVLKFQSEAKQTEYALKIRDLIDESKFGVTTTWKTRSKNFLEALVLMEEAQEKKVDLEKLVEKATGELEVPKVYQRVLADSLLRNFGIAEEFELLTEENLERLSRGELLQISGGGYRGEFAVFDNMVPYRYSPEMEMRFANLLLKPRVVAQHYPDAIADGSLLIMSACRSAELMTETSYTRAMEAVRRSGKL